MQTQTRKFLICLGIIYEETQFNRDYLDFISLPEAENRTTILKQMPKVMEMKNVSFRYPNGEEGLDTRLGNEFGGKELSGGQWQKLALARTLYKDSEFVVMDEPTSAIDPLTEMDILKTFLSSVKGRTSVIVSHRVGICTCADQVIVMKEGKVAECGTHDELMKKKGVYYEMFRAQAKWYN